jgi:hypothetical protein
MEQQGKLDESVQRIYQYLQIKPDDADAKVFFAGKNEQRTALVAGHFANALNKSSA